MNYIHFSAIDLEVGHISVMRRGREVETYTQIYVCRNILIQLCVNLFSCHTNYHLVNRVI